MDDGKRRPKNAPIDPTVLDSDDLGKLNLPEAIGKFRVKRLIGSGGMGTVYLAQQNSPKRDVAIKVMNSGVVSQKSLRRFEFESQILARLHHQVIAQVYEAGTYDDGSGARPFFAMEYVSSARELGEYVKRKQSSVRDRLELFRAVCEGVEYGHRRGVIHRDLKPSNILVNVDGQPKIIDFGVARSTNSDAMTATLATEAGQLIGTLQYMSPEQIELDPSDLDTRSDVYALGVILYELLVGKVPYDVTQTTITRAAELIRDTQPARLREIDATLKGDLETICLKSLEKDRDQRYQSAGELSEDIGRYLADEAILAKPPTRVEQLRRFVRKNKAVAGSVVLVSLAMVAATVISIIFSVEAAHQRDAAGLALERAELKTKELQTVADFQVDQLSSIDVAAVGASLRQSMIRQLQLDRSAAAGADFTGAALQLLKEHIFDRTQTMIDQQLSDQPLVQAQLLQAMADSLQSLGLLDEAMGAQARAMELRVAGLGRAHMDTLFSISRMSILLTRQGKYDEAMAYMVEVLEARRRLLGDDDPDTLNTLNAMGNVLQQQGKYDEATRYLAEALEAQRRILGDDHPDTLSSISAMGTLLYRQSNYDEATPYLVEALETRRRTLGNEHRSTLNSINVMGNLLGVQGKYEEAEPYFIECLEIRRRILGDEHPSTLASVNNMAVLLTRQGKYDEAMVYQVEVAQASRRTLGDEHPATLNKVNNLGTLLVQQGKYDEARPYVSEALEARRRLLGDDHPDTLSSIVDMAALLSSQGKYEEAMLYCSEALETRRRTLGDENPATFASLASIGELLERQGKYEQALPYLEQSLAGLRKTMGDEHPSTLQVMAALGGLLGVQGAYEEARPYLEQSLAGFRRTLGDDNPLTISLMHEMGVLMTSQGEYDEAFAYLEEALAIRRRAFGREHPVALETTRRMGILLSRQGKYAQALPYMREALDGFSGVLGASHPHTIESLKTMVEFHTNWHEADPDGGHDATAADYQELLQERTVNTEPSVP